MAGLLGGPLLPTPCAVCSAGPRHGIICLDCGPNGAVRLLPTPNAQDGNGGKAPRGGSNTHNTGTKRQVPLTDLPDLLPTPTSRDHKGRNQRDDETCLAGALLPTPAAADGQRGQDFARAGRDSSGGDDLVTIAVKADRDNQWGKYAAAIARWEHVTGTPAPAPTEPNKNGNPRLSAAFSSWLMGWPDGWVTDPAIGISRNRSEEAHV